MIWDGNNIRSFENSAFLKSSSIRQLEIRLFETRALFAHTKIQHFYIKSNAREFGIRSQRPECIRLFKNSTFLKSKIIREANSIWEFEVWFFESSNTFGHSKFDYMKLEKYSLTRKFDISTQRQTKPNNNREFDIRFFENPNIFDLSKIWHF